MWHGSVTRLPLVFLVDSLVVVHECVLSDDVVQAALVGAAGQKAERAVRMLELVEIRRQGDVLPGGAPEEGEGERREQSGRHPVLSFVPGYGCWIDCVDVE